MPLLGFKFIPFRLMGVLHEIEAGKKLCVRVFVVFLHDFYMMCIFESIEFEVFQKKIIKYYHKNLDLAK